MVNKKTAPEVVGATAGAFNLPDRSQADRISIMASGRAFRKEPVHESLH
jgi:hypothetical protein